MFGSLLLIGGAVGTALAMFDAAQIALIRYYKKKRKQN